MTMAMPMTSNTTNHRRLAAGACCAFAALIVLSACSEGYHIRGRVIRGEVPSVRVVSGDDPRLSGSNITGGGAMIQGILEPNTPTEMKDLGRHKADSQGFFAIPVDAFGARVLEYEAQIVARREGNAGAKGILELPRGSDRLLITLPLGPDNLVVPEPFLDRTIRDAKPYIDEKR